MFEALCLEIKMIKEWEREREKKKKGGKLTKEKKKGKKWQKEAKKKYESGTES